MCVLLIGSAVDSYICVGAADGGLYCLFRWTLQPVCLLIYRLGISVYRFEIVNGKCSPLARPGSNILDSNWLKTTSKVSCAQQRTYLSTPPPSPQSTLPTVPAISILLTALEIYSQMSS